MYRILLFVFFCLLGAGPVAAQNQSFAGFVEAGDTAFAKKDFYNAYRLYAIACEEDWNTIKAYEERLSEVFYKTGLSAYKATAYVPAEQALLKLISRPDARSFELAEYYLAESTFRQGRYDQAAVFYEQFLEGNPGAPEQYLEKARLQISEANEAIERLSRPDDVLLRHLPSGINTEDSDVMYVHGPGATRFFSSNNYLYKKDKFVSRRLLSRIMRQTGENTAEPLPALINVPGKNVAHTAFNADMSQAYYSVCEYVGSDEMRCDLHVADVDSEGKWSNPLKLAINEEGVSMTQPSFGYSVADSKYYLYFASDRSGGKGGLDLYRAEALEDGTFGTIESIEELNTSGNDAAPFWYAPAQTLYFTTDGRFSFGGLDIYKSFNIAGTFLPPSNLGTPVNSAADEAYYTRFEEPNVAYVASRNATGEAIFYSEERDVCCYDLYEFTPDDRINLRAITINALTELDLNGATVKLCQITPDGPVEVDEIVNAEGNIFDFQVEPGLKYQLKAEKDGFTSVIDVFDLSAEEFVGVSFIERVLPLTPTVMLDVFTFNNVDQTDLNDAPVTLYELTDEGERIEVEQKLNPGANDTYFPLEIGKRYLVVGEKTGFGAASEEVDLRTYDPDAGTTSRRVDLYLGQMLDVFVIDGGTELPLDGATVTMTSSVGAKGAPETNPDGHDFHYVVNLNQDFTFSVTRPGYFSRTVSVRFTPEDVARFDGRLSVTIPLISDDINAFLDLRVYFDNDHPDPDAYRSTTRLSYDETYEPYLARRDVFVESISKGLGNEEAFLLRDEVNEFFEQEVIPGYEDLLKLAEALVIHMENGRAYQIKMLGFASPRAPDAYNLRLSARRNVCLQNFFERFQDGALKPYIDSKQLTFATERRGEEKELGRIYELIEEERVSIFSVEASLERRVEFPKIFTTNSRK